MCGLEKNLVLAGGIACGLLLATIARPAEAQWQLGGSHHHHDSFGHRVDDYGHHTDRHGHHTGSYGVYDRPSYGGGYYGGYNSPGYSSPKSSEGRSAFR